MHANRQSEFSERQTVLRRSVQRSRASKGLEAHFRLKEQVLKQFEALEVMSEYEMPELCGICQQTADPEAIVGTPAASFTHFAHVIDGGLEIGFAAGRTDRCMLQLQKCDQAVQRIVLPHRPDERAAEIDAHLPDHPLTAADFFEGKCAVRCPREFSS